MKYYNLLSEMRDWPRGVPVGEGPRAVFRRKVQADPRVPVDTGWTWKRDPHPKGGSGTDEH